MTYLVVECAQRELAAVAAVEAAGIACELTVAGELQRLEPIGSCGLDGWRAEFRDHSERNVAGVVLVNPPRLLPWLDPGLFDWQAGRAGLVAGVLAPGLANFYLAGVGTAAFRPGEAELLVALIRAEARLRHPLVDELARFVAPRHDAPSRRDARRLERRVRGRLRPERSQPWWHAAGEIEGPLLAARAV